LRLVQVAKELGITSKELRKELEKTNFGIKPSDREVDDGLAAGIIRVLTPKFKEQIKKAQQLRRQQEKAEQKEIEQQEKALENEKKQKKEEEKRAQEELMQQLEREKKRKEEKLKNRQKKKKVKPKTAIMRKIELTPEPTKKKIKATKKITKEEAEASGLTAEEILIEKQLEKEILKETRKKTAAKKVEKEPKAQPQIKAKSGTIKLPEITSVKEYAEKTGIPVNKVIAQLLKNGIMATINQQLDYETAAIIAEELDVKVKKQISEASSEDLFSGDLDNLLKDEPENLKERPAIVSVMGHVDHGKTKILDSIRKANVIDTESGGITQHIGAYQVKHNKKTITFLDTPGHEAFTLMRARGAKATDIAILVVAADEGVKPQTIESINHAKEAKIPIIVAINKMDKENANPDKVKGELAEHGLQSEDWGGEIIMVPVSAMTGEGIEDLLEMILLVAEMGNLKANPKRPAVGTVIESHLDKSLGPVATILINTGTLKIMDNVIIGTTTGRVKTMIDHHGKRLRKLPPSGAAQISGLDVVPQSGDILQVMKNEKAVKEKLEQILELKEGNKQTLGSAGVKEIMNQISSGNMDFLKIVLKTDTKGSLEAIRQSLAKIKNKDVGIKIIHAGIGGITESDIMMASASQGLVIGFHVLPNVNANKIAEKEGVEIQTYEVIYKLLDDMKKILTGMLKPELIERILGRSEVKQIFFTKKKTMIIGCRVRSGSVENKARIRLIRNDEVVGEGVVTNLRSFEKNVKEVKEGNECGIQINVDLPIEEGDILEVFVMKEKMRTLES